MGDTVDASNATMAETNLGVSSGLEYIGVSLTPASTPTFGYFVVQQTAATDLSGVTDTLVETVYDPSGAAVQVAIATPEPAPASLLLAGAMGAAGLAA